MVHLESVGTPDRDAVALARERSGRDTAEWNAEIINEIPDKLVAWRSIEGSDVVSAGSVHFDDAGRGRGTRIRVRLQYSPPGGKVGATIARLLGADAGSEIREDLRRFKQLVEAGEVATDRRTAARIETMKAVCWYGTNDVRVARVPDPTILNPRDAIVKITPTAICGSDLHLYDGYIPTMKSGDILGHEFMGEVVEVGAREQEPQGRRPRRRPVHHRVRPLLLLRAGAVVALRQLQPERLDGGKAVRLLAVGAVRLLAHDSAAMPAGRPSTCACRSPTSARSKFPNDLTDEQVLFLSDILPTGYMAAENCNIQPGDTVAVWGCGPVGQFAIRSAWMLGAGACDRDRRVAGAAADGFATRQRRGHRLRRDDVFEELKDDDRWTGSGRLHRRRRHGSARRDDSDACVDKVKTAAFLATDRLERAAPGDSRVPQGRHRVDPRRLRRVPRQDAVRRGVQQGADATHGTDPRAPLLRCSSIASIAARSTRHS